MKPAVVAASAPPPVIETRPGSGPVHHVSAVPQPRPLVTARQPMGVVPSVCTRSWTVLHLSEGR
ncbi:hypothetical protein ACFW2Y_10510 [Streptomyces sp. NPDC058877]|uniref:hypothetical protein n=1 Tax=unclassified Streptomyces TaxID=2593676 RepID=UPI0036CD5C0F